MNHRIRALRGTWLRAFLCGSLLFGSAAAGIAQGGNVSERSFRESKADVEKALKTLQPSLSGHLPVLDGFAVAAEHPLDQYQRGYYQSTMKVIETASGRSLVRVTSKITAWHADSVASKSGYKLMISNGRLESDLLDQLADQLAAQAATQGPVREKGAGFPPNKAASSALTPDANQPTISAPVPRLPDTGGTFSSSLAQSLSAQEPGSPASPKKLEESGQSELLAQAQSLEEILKNQAHPKNLVAVKKSGTPVVATPSLSAKTLFMASAHDEFEMLDFNADWVHVRISGLSRGWIWRTSLELPDSVPDTGATSSGPIPVAAELFHVTREETATFPGDWGPLRGKSVRIISAEKIDEAAKSGPRMRLEYAKSEFDRSYAEIAQKYPEVAGIVLIFDSADGGMIAATMPTLQQWKTGALSDSALWHQCFFDPPESLETPGAAASQ